MASIQCAIELYDGVTPVLSNMTVALDGLCQRFEAFEGSAGLSFEGDLSGVAAATGCINEMAGALSGAAAYQETLNASILRGSGYATEFGASALLISESFGAAAAEVTGIFNNLDMYISSFAGRLPGYFVAPLGTIAGMFQSLASSIRSSLASVNSAISATTASAKASVSSVKSAVSSMNSSLSSVSAAASTLSVSVSESQTAEALSLFSAAAVPDSTAAVSALSAEHVSVSMPETESLVSDEGIYELLASGYDPVRSAVQPVFNVQISNENHISSEVDAESVLREFELRLCDAVQSSAEGVLL